MNRSGLLAVGGGGLGGAAVLAALSGSPLGVLLVYAAPLPLLAVGFGLGLGAFGLAAATGVLVALLFGGFTAAGLFGGMHVIPSWLIVQQALRPRASSADGWQPIGHVLAVLTLTVAFATAAGAIAGRGETGIEASVQAMLNEAAEMAAPNIDDGDRVLLLRQLTPLFLGFSGVAWLLMLMINAVVAQGLLAARGRSIRPSPAWSALRVPGWYDWVPVAVAVAALALPGDAGFVARNLSVILLAPYFLVGLAVMHMLARRTKAPTLVLTAFYLFLLLFFLFAVAIVAAVGVVEQWIGIRKRLRGASSPPHGS